MCHPSCSMSKPPWLPSSFSNLPLGPTPSSPPAPKHSPEPTGAAAVQPGNGFSPQLSTQGSLWQKTLISHPYVSHRCPHSPYRWRWWICRKDPSLEPIQPPTEKQGAEESTKCYSGLEDSASAQPAGWKEPVTSKEGQQEDRDVVQREH